MGSRLVALALVATAISSVAGVALAGSSHKPAESDKGAASAPIKPVNPSSALPALPAATPKAGGKPSFPRTLDEAKAEAAAAKKPQPVWSDDEITLAKARCTAILQRITAIAIPQPPLREGQCGTPAPIQLVSIGKNPEVAISPPAIITCELAEALNQWLEKDIQPLARKHLGSEVIRIETMSDYSCRNAYGRAGGKLSEHGLANALDIRGFVTAAAKTAYLLEDWGETQREVTARIAAAKAEADRAEKARAEAEKAAQQNLKADASSPASAPPTALPATAGAPAGGIARGAIVEGVPKVTVTIPGARQTSVGSAAPALTPGKAEPNHLGGPYNNGKARTEAAVTVAGVQITIGLPMKRTAPGVKGEFLRKAHAGACRIFGTTLGPEANAAHRNHFHVDMAKRKVEGTKICD